jgi:hypothetical protein
MRWNLTSRLTNFGVNNMLKPHWTRNPNTVRTELAIKVLDIMIALDSTKSEAERKRLNLLHRCVTKACRNYGKAIDRQILSGLTPEVQHQVMFYL